jgi:hypothetical protein
LMAVEHVFSQGQQLLHFTQNRLSPSSIRAIMCFGAWSCKDLVDMLDIVDVKCGKEYKNAPRELSVGCSNDVQ